MTEYKEAIKKSMKILAKDNNIKFIGYNLNFGSRAYGTLEDIPKSKCLETPVAENLMAGLAMGMALEEYKPVLIFERHDFMLNSLDALINHLDKFEIMSNGQFIIKIIIRAIIGSNKPIDPGPQHIQDFSEIFKKIFSFPIFEPKTPEEVLKAYEFAKSAKTSVMIIERKELY